MGTATPGISSDFRGTSYPFVTDEVPFGGARFPRDILEDLVLILGPGIEFVQTESVTRLVRVENTGVTIDLVFLVHDTEITVPVVVGEWGRLTTVAVDESTPCSGDWVDGWATFINPQALETLVPNTNDVVTGVLELEPTVVRSTRGSSVSGISLANTDRTMSPPPGEFGSTSRLTRPWVSCVQGPLWIREGYNARIQSDPRNNLLILGAGVGLGDGQHCDEVPTYPGEVPPFDWSSTLDGSLRCSQTVRSVNGVPGPDLNIESGSGVRVEAVPEENKVIVRLDA